MRSHLHPKGELDSFPLTLELRVVRADRHSCACSGWVASRTGISRPRERRQNQIQAEWLCSSGISPCSGLGWEGEEGRRVREPRNECFEVPRPGYWLTFLCEVPPLFFSLSAFPLNPALHHAAASGSTLGRCLYSCPSTLLLHWEWN